jgi:hypothetical protein
VVTVKIDVCNRTVHGSNSDYPCCGPTERLPQLGSRSVYPIPQRYSTSCHPFSVWGPEPIRLGFIGAPIASAISFNLVSLISFAYGTLFVPRTAWHPLSRRSFMNLGILVRLGLSGIGMSILLSTNARIQLNLRLQDKWQVNGGHGNLLL